MIGTGLDVWEIVAASRRFTSPQETAAKTDLTEPQIRLALAYHQEFPHEIDEAIPKAEPPLRELQRRYPTIDTLISG